MGFDPRVHDAHHVVKAGLGAATRPFTPAYAADELLVLNYHGTQTKFLPNLERQLDWLGAHFDFAGPDDLEPYFRGERPSRPRVLLSFDDGVRNNLMAAAILERRGIRAVFLVIPGFIDTPEAEQPAFFARNIRSRINPHVDAEPEDFSAMSWRDLSSLQERGHAIGAHTMTHTLVTARSSLENSQYEIVGAAQRIEEMMGERPTVFCGPRDSLQSCGEKEMGLIRAEYQFFFSTIPGSNVVRQRYFVRRINVESWWLRSAVSWAVSSLEWKRWRQKEGVFSAIVTSSPSRSASGRIDSAG